MIAFKMREYHAHFGILANEKAFDLAVHLQGTRNDDYTTIVLDLEIVHRKTIDERYDHDVKEVEDTRR